MSNDSRTIASLFMMVGAAAVLQLAGCGDGGKSGTTAGTTTGTGGAAVADRAPSPSVSSTSARVAGSCNNAASGFCSDYTGSKYKAETVRQACDQQKIAFGTDACPVAGRVGTCVMNQGKNNESLYRYYTDFPGFGIKPKGGAVTAAEEQCARLKGVWVKN